MRPVTFPMTKEMIKTIRESGSMDKEEKLILCGNPDAPEPQGVLENKEPRKPVEINKDFVEFECLRKTAHLNKYLRRAWMQRIYRLYKWGL